MTSYPVYGFMLSLVWLNCFPNTSSQRKDIFIDEPLPDEVLHVEGYNSSDGKTHYIRWRKFPDSFGIEFLGLKQTKLRRSPPQTIGEPWPIPQSYKVHETLNTISKTNIDFKVKGSSCDILDKAINRYRDVIKNIHIDNGEDNLHQAPHSEINQGFESRKQSTNQQTRDIRVISIDVKHPCDKYPSLKSVESYRLLVKQNNISITAVEVWGALRGMETLSQIIFSKDNKLYVYETEIKDYPRFPHRGLLIDTSRHYITKTVIFEMLDAMAQNKMNVFHWHMVDDQSFPFQSKMFPDLSRKGAYHHTMVYTHDDIADIIEHARLRGIRVIPEFDIPGHTFSWGLAYPDLLTQCQVKNEYIRGFLGPLNPTNERVYKLITDLYNEVLHIFKDTFVHIGGDEVFTECWSSNLEVRRLFISLYKKYNAKRKGIILRANSTEPLQKPKKGERVNMNLLEGLTSSNFDELVAQHIWQYFNDRVFGDIKNLGSMRGEGLTTIVWDDALKAGVKIPNTTVIQVWTSDQVLKDTVRKGYTVIYSHCWYLDQVKSGVQWTKYYICDPSDLASEHDKNIIGGEACLWTEFITSESLMTTLWPRASAVAERLWSSRSATDLMYAARRLGEHRCRMVRRGINAGFVNGPEYCVMKNKDAPLNAGPTLHATSVEVQTEETELTEDELKNVAVYFLLLVIALCLFLFLGKRRRRKFRIFRLMS